MCTYLCITLLEIGCTKESIFADICLLLMFVVGIGKPVATIKKTGKDKWIIFKH